jgi:serine/threonine-protein kinase
LDAVVLKALAKNPENRYQSAADMRTDLIRVHSGEAPDAPKLFTDAEHSNLLSTGSARGDHLQPTEPIPARSRSIRRWVIAVAMLAVLAVVVTVGFTVFGARDARIPDVHDLTQDAAVTALQNAGFKTNIQNKPDSTVRYGNVIDTAPEANSTVNAGDEITVNVSMGATQEQVPDCVNATYGDCVGKLEAAGFDKPVQASKSSTPEQQGRVVETSPPANSMAAINTEITISVGSGPGTTPVPPVANQTWDVAQQVLGAAKFTKTIQVPVDSVLPAGQVVGTLPPAGTVTSLDTLIQVQVSKGNQILVPDLTGLFYADALQALQSAGFVGNFDKRADVPGPGDQRAKVVRQDPLPRTGVNKDGTVTVNYGS